MLWRCCCAALCPTVFLHYGFSASRPKLIVTSKERSDTKDKWLSIDLIKNNQCSCLSSRTRTEVLGRWDVCLGVGNNEGVVRKINDTKEVGCLPENCVKQC